ncbi:MAG: Ig-like domain-containing protein [Muribaculaceae bacterium]|nr:Ig-like domain-containing protein [Muribaculaceae bacterium]
MKTIYRLSHSIVISLLIALFSSVAAQAAEKTIVVDMSGLPIQVILDTTSGTAAIDSERLWYDNKDSYSDIDLVIPEFITYEDETYRLIEIKSCFRFCTCLRSVVIPNSVTAIESRTFYNCTSLETLVLSNALTSLSEGLFSGCKNLRNIEIPESVQSIESNVFYNCNSLELLTIPIGVTNVGGRIFGSVNSITDIYIKSSDPTIFPNDLFYSVPIQSSSDGTFQVNENVKIHVPEESLSKYEEYFDWKSGVASPFVAMVSEPEISASIVLDRESVTMQVGDEIQLQATVTSDESGQATVSWESSDEGVVKVDENGNLTAVGRGEAVITAKSGDLTATCNVTVTVIAVTDIQIKGISATGVYYIGRSYQLTAVIIPENATDQTVTWETDNESVATVTAEGLLTCHSEGEVSVTARAGGDYRTVKIPVKPVTLVSMTLAPEILDLTVGQDGEVTLVMTPSDVTDKTFEWLIDNEEVVSVRDNTVKALRVGETKIRAYSKGIRSNECKVRVTLPEVSSLTLSASSLTMTTGRTAQLSVSIEPDNAKDVQIEWSSSDEEIATVDENGLVTAIGAGEAVITAKSGNVAVTCRVTVELLKPESLTLEQSSVSVLTGETKQLKATILPEDGDFTVEWSVADTNVATITADGLLTAVSAGETTVTAKCGELTAGCKVYVTRNTIAVESISLSESAVTLTAGEETVLTVTISPADATDPTVMWATSDETVATVTNGTVKAVGEGSATITASVGDKKAECRVTVEPIKPQSLTLELTSVSLLIGETKQLKATVLPESGEFAVEWSVTDTNVATITADGLLTAVSAGETTVTAKCGELTAECKVYVTRNVIAVESISLSESAVTLTTGEETILTVTISPADATDPTVMWATSDETVATVTNGTVKAVGEGSATITASVGDKKAECNVTVKSSIIAVETITVAPSALVLKCGDTGQLKAEVRPDNATDKTIKWSSSDTDVATVDNNGVVTAIKPGSVNITASSGDKTASCRLIVNPIEVTEIVLSETEVELTPGKNITLQVTIKPDNATDKTVVWSSDNDEVAIVSPTGDVTAIGEGEAMVTARCGSQTAVCIVNVVPGTITLESIRISETEIELETGESKRLTFVTEPDDADYEIVEWRSSNERIATVSSDGVVSGIAKGEAFIWLTVDNKADACKISVVDPIKTSISDVESDNGPIVRTMPGSIVITNLDIKDAVGIYTITGMTVRPQTPANTTDLTIKINSKGIYIVRINNRARKILVR